MFKAGQTLDDHPAPTDFQNVGDHIDQDDFNRLLISSILWGHTHRCFRHVACSNNSKVVILQSWDLTDTHVIERDFSRKRNMEEDGWTPGWDDSMGSANGTYCKSVLMFPCLLLLFGYCGTSIGGSPMWNRKISKFVWDLWYKIGKLRIVSSKIISVKPHTWGGSSYNPLIVAGGNSGSVWGLIPAFWHNSPLFGPPIGYTCLFHRHDSGIMLQLPRRRCACVCVCPHLSLSSRAIHHQLIIIAPGLSAQIEAFPRLGLSGNSSQLM